MLRRGSRGTVLAVGPLADAVVDATLGLDVTVLYAATIRPLDVATLRDSLQAPDVVLVEPYLAGTSVPAVAEALRDLPHRILGLGVGRRELRRYGTPAEHQAAHGLDARSLRAEIASFLRVSVSASLWAGWALIQAQGTSRPSGGAGRRVALGDVQDHLHGRGPGGQLAGNAGLLTQLIGCHIIATS